MVFYFTSIASPVAFAHTLTRYEFWWTNVISTTPFSSCEGWPTFLEPAWIQCVFNFPLRLDSKLRRVTAIHWYIQVSFSVSSNFFCIKMIKNLTAQKKNITYPKKKLNKNTAQSKHEKINESATFLLLQREQKMILYWPSRVWAYTDDRSWNVFLALDQLYRSWQSATYIIIYHLLTLKRHTYGKQISIYPQCCASKHKNGDTFIFKKLKPKSIYFLIYFIL